jgi:hypothetical protein
VPQSHHGIRGDPRAYIRAIEVKNTPLYKNTPLVIPRSGARYRDFLVK